MIQSRGREILSRVLRQASGGWLLVSILSIAINLILLVPALYMMQVFDRVLRSARLETLLFLSVAALACLLIYALLESLRLRTLTRIGEWIEEQLLAKVIAGSLASGIAAKGLASGRAPIADLKTVRAFLSGPSVPSMCDVPWTPFFIFICFLLHFDIGLLALAFAGIILGLTFVNEYWTRASQFESALKHALVQQSVVEATRNSEAIAAMGLEPRIAERVAAANDVALQSARRFSDRSGDVMALAKFVRVVASLLIIALGAYLTLKNELTGGGMIAGSIIMARALAPLDQAIAAWRGFQAAREAWARLAECLAQAERFDAAVELPPPRGRLTVDNLVYFVPGTERAIVRGVSFELRAGETLMIVGPSGSGKSTLCKMLVGALAPFRGVARLDGADLQHYPSRQRALHIGYMPQDLQIFSGSIRAIIARMGDADDGEVVAAAQRAHCHEAILSVPSGYGARLHDGGAPLSGGEKARLALARSVFGDPRLVVLDEPNANLDPVGERSLMDCIAELKNRGTTVVIVSHRMHLAHLSDKMLVMREGRISMYGPTAKVQAKMNEQTSTQVHATMASSQHLRPVPTNPIPGPSLKVSRGEGGDAQIATASSPPQRLRPVQADPFFTATPSLIEPQRTEPERVAVEQPGATTRRRHRAIKLAALSAIALLSTTEAAAHDDGAAMCVRAGSDDVMEHWTAGRSAPPSDRGECMQREFHK